MPVHQTQKTAAYVVRRPALPLPACIVRWLTIFAVLNHVVTRMALLKIQARRSVNVELLHATPPAASFASAQRLRATQLQERTAMLRCRVGAAVM